MELAQRKYEEELESIKKDYRSMERDIRALWTDQEIDAAKRGYMLVDGREVAL
jgi:hypothetical protein